MLAGLLMPGLGAEMSMLGWLTMLTHLPHWVSAGLGMPGQAWVRIPACTTARV